MPVKAIPDGYHSITPYLIVKDGNAAVKFYQNAFSAEIILVLNTPDGGIAHAEIKIGDSHIMLAEEYMDMGFVSPETLGGAGVSLMLYLENVDQSFTKAINAGGIELKPVSDQFYGDRAGTLKDPFGHIWTLGTHKEDLSEDEIKQRMMAEFSE
ncbi:VOC family protein [Thalassotalea nanhaiensis]|uniref:VOC family protein n=1 Tax=Thalassotalea nanhaiensis TaxID=3065648 RepID=A0ABY9TPC2_9GAMM|nr:VOC family protein [Colwelliaceae bacterium SQ345]